MQSSTHCIARIRVDTCAHDGMPAGQPARDTIGMYVSGRRGSLEPTIDRKRQLYRKFVDYYSRSFGFARIILNIYRRNRSCALKHTHYIGKSHKESLQECNCKQPCTNLVLYTQSLTDSCCIRLLKACESDVVLHEVVLDIYIYIYIFIYMYVCMYVCRCAPMYVGMNVRMYVCMYVES